MKARQFFTIAAAMIMIVAAGFTNVKKDPKPPGTHFQGTPMPYFMRIVSGTGLHAGYLPGYPASHGCIRLPQHIAKALFNTAPARSKLPSRRYTWAKFTQPSM